MIRTIAINHEEKILLNLDVTNLNKQTYKWFWVDFSQPTEEEVQLLSTFFHFHPLAIEDCIHLLQRPKLDYYQQNTFFVFQALQPDLEKKEVDLFLGEESLPSINTIQSKSMKFGNALQIRKNFRNGFQHLFFTIF